MDGGVMAQKINHDKLNQISNMRKRGYEHCDLYFNENDDEEILDVQKAKDVQEAKLDSLSDEELHQRALFNLSMAFKCKTASPLNYLINNLSGSRKNLVRNWVKFFAPINYSSQDDNFSFNRGRTKNLKRKETLDKASNRPFYLDEFE